MKRLGQSSLDPEQARRGAAALSPEILACVTRSNSTWPHECRLPMLVAKALLTPN